MSRGTNPSLGHLIARICGTRSGDRQTDQLHHCDVQNSKEANHCLTRFYINPKPQTKAESNSMIGCRGGGATMWTSPSSLFGHHALKSLCRWAKERIFVLWLIRQMLTSLSEAERLLAYLCHKQILSVGCFWFTRILLFWYMYRGDMYHVPRDILFVSIMSSIFCWCMGR